MPIGNASVHSRKIISPLFSVKQLYCKKYFSTLDCLLVFTDALNLYVELFKFVLCWYWYFALTLTKKVIRTKHIEPRRKEYFGFINSFVYILLYWRKIACTISQFVLNNKLLMIIYCTGKNNKVKILILDFIILLF